MKTKEELQALLMAQLSASRQICDACDRENRDFTDDERSKVAAYLAEAKRLRIEINTLEVIDTKKKKLEQDEAIRQEILGMWDGGQAKGKAGAWSNAFIKERERVGGAKELITPSGSVGVPALSQTIPAVGEVLETILQVLPPTPTSDSAVKYLRETERTHNAAPVAAGATKPTSVYALEEVNAPCEVIAHLSEPIKRQYLNDATTLQRYLDTVLRQGEQLALENQIINGTGTTPQLQGMLTVSGHIVLPLGESPDGLDASRKGITMLELLSLPASGMIFCIHPNDWEDFELIESPMSATYKMGGTDKGQAPIDRQKRQLWGVPVVPSVAVPEGTLLLFHKSALQLYEREGVIVDWSENTISIVDGSPVSDFTRNLIRFRCEGRWALAIYKPDAIVEILLEEGS